MKISDLAFTPPREAEPEPTLPPGNEPTLEERFADIRRRYPDRIALADETGRLSYAELDALSGDIARFILQLGLGAEPPVAVMCGRSNLFTAAALGIWRAGAIYVPLDPGLPRKRREQMLNNCAAPLLITDAAHVDDAQRLQYACPALAHLLCPEVEQFEQAVEAPGDLMSLELWDHVTAADADGSWKSYFDGRPLAGELLQGLADNLVRKTAAQLHPDSRVLDVGSGAGAVAKSLLARCGHYTAVDLSRRELDRLERLAREPGAAALDTHQMEAIDLHLLPAAHYDLVTLNSVIENFPGYNYLRRVLEHALRALRDDGTIFLGGVWDLDKKPQFLEDLRHYGEQGNGWSGLMRLEGATELFVPRAFFEDWAAHRPEALEISFTTPDLPGRELTDYRFDVTIRKLGGAPRSDAPLQTVRHGAAALRQARPATPVAAEPAAAAYIIYTSGTTGEPKGVVIEHHSLLNLADALLATVYAPRWGEAPVRVALLASFSFDASLQQIAAALLGGHTLYVVSDALRRDPPQLHRFLERHKIDVCDGTPSLFALLTDFWLDEGQSSAVDTFILGGEALRADHLQRFYGIPAHRDSRLFNAYGPTECCVDATLHGIDFERHRDFASPPIGRPLANLEVSIRDRRGARLPDGVPGELWIGGRGIGRGYYGDADLTETRFVPAEGRRWYRTGDLVRRQADGLLFFVGREDHQVKVGGYRVELGEIEAVLNRCPLVREAVVVADDFGGSGVRTLAAYLVPAGELDAAQIRAYLAIHIPAYAVPSYFVGLPSLPVTVSGKIDRKSLPSPVQASAADTARRRRPPSGPVEERLAGLWRQLLGRAVDDAESDFFELGGHSVLAIRLISLIEKAFGRRLSLSRLFKASTIAALAGLLEEADGPQAAASPVIPLATEGDGTPMVLFHPVGGHVLCYRPLAQQLAAHHPVYAVEAAVNGDRPQLPRVEEMATSYLDALGETIGNGPVVFVGWSFGGLVAFEAARRFSAGGGTVEGLILLDSVADNRATRELMQKDEAAMLATLFSEQLPVSEEQLRAHTGDERLAFLIRVGTQQGLLPADCGPQRMRQLLQTYHNNALAAARYRAPVSDGRALLIRPTVASAAALNIPDDPLQGWGTLLTGGVTLRWISGTHESMLKDHAAAELAAHMRAYLEGERS